MDHWFLSLDGSAVTILQSDYIKCSFPGWNVLFLQDGFSTNIERSFELVQNNPKVPKFPRAKNMKTAINGVSGILFFFH
jgi:hypothetical protein